MSRFIKFLWSLVSLIPLFFVLMLVFFADYFWNKTMQYSLPLGIISAAIFTVLLIIGIVIIKILIKKLNGISFEIEEIESKDGTVASSIMTYLLPLITITFNEINWMAFAGLVIVMIILLCLTRVVLLNPLVYFFGYKYYTIKAKSGAKYTLITRREKFNKNNKKILVEIFEDIYIELEDTNA